MRKSKIQLYRDEQRTNSLGLMISLERIRCERCELWYECHIITLGSVRPVSSIDVEETRRKEHASVNVPSSFVSSAN